MQDLFGRHSKVENLDLRARAVHRGALVLARDIGIVLCALLALGAWAGFVAAWWPATRDADVACERVDAEGVFVAPLMEHGTERDASSVVACCLRLAHLYRDRGV